MASAADSVAGIESPGFSLQLQRELRLGSLRYFDAAGALAANLRELIGPLPRPLEALQHELPGTRQEIFLAWRSPTETLIMTADGAAFAALEARAAEHAACGCLVDQTAGLWAWQATGPRVRELLVRLGSAASVPALGEARSSRIAELPVLALCVREGQFMLLVERVYSEHLLGWMRETAADF